jgi:hypothetical protein
VNAIPPCVARFLERAGCVAGGVRLLQEGRLKASPSSSRWMAFTATHEARADRPEFHWQARVRIAPLIRIAVDDRLGGGAGSGQVRLWGVHVARDGGTPEMHSGALHRYLAEGVWVPGALRPGSHLRWYSLGPRRALATCTDRACEVSLEFASTPRVTSSRSTHRRDGESSAVTTSSGLGKGISAAGPSTTGCAFRSRARWDGMTRTRFAWPGPGASSPSIRRSDRPATGPAAGTVTRAPFAAAGGSSTASRRCRPRSGCRSPPGSRSAGSCPRCSPGKSWCRRTPGSGPART